MKVRFWKDAVCGACAWQTFDGCDEPNPRYIEISEQEFNTIRSKSCMWKLADEKD